MARTLITNVGHGPATLPMPYGVALGEGRSAVVADDVPTVSGYLGASVGPVFKVTAVADGGPVSFGTGVVTPKATAVRGADGMTVGLIIEASAAAGVGGTADDVIIYDGNSPFPFEIEDMVFGVSTPQAASSVQLRDAKGGVGNALSSVLPTTAAGKQWDAGSSPPNSVAAGGTLVLRRSNNLVVGEMVIHVVRTG